MSKFQFYRVELSPDRDVIKLRGTDQPFSAFQLKATLQGDRPRAFLEVKPTGSDASEDYHVYEIGDADFARPLFAGIKTQSRYLEELRDKDNGFLTGLQRSGMQPDMLFSIKDLTGIDQEENGSSEAFQQSIEKLLETPRISTREAKLHPRPSQGRTVAENFDM